MKTGADEKDVIDALGRIIAQNADWLDGRTFQRLALEAADAYFEEGDTDQLLIRRQHRRQKG